MENTSKTYMTWHCSTANYKDKDFTMDKIYGLTNGKAKYRLIKIGAGFVILPETSRYENITEHEIRKALGLIDTCPLAETVPEKITNYKIENSDTYINSPFYMALTQEQVRLLQWLFENDYLDSDLFEENPEIVFEKI